MKTIWLAFLSLTLCACTKPLTTTERLDQIESPDQPWAVAIEAAVKRASADVSAGHVIWPGFDPLSVPLAIFDGQRTYLFRHPSPPEPFRPDGAFGSDVYVMDGRNENVTANTNSDIGGVPTATLLLDPAHANGPATALAAVAIHEAFHVYQREHHPSWLGNEADLFVYPTDSSELLALRRQETEALRNALHAKDAPSLACWTRTAISLRDQRFTRMDPTFAAYERGTELNEGLATYVQMRVEGKTTVEFPADEFKPAAIRQRAYATGPALAVLLDRVDPGWNASFESNDKQTLDQALSQATGSGETCAFDANAVLAMQARAQNDIAALATERQELLSEFLAQTGWRIIVRADKANPLWPQGFDPVNVERLDKDHILHSRFVTLGNDQGKIEVLNAESLTQGAGAHPLFNGVERVEVGGLEEPQIVSTGSAVDISAPGVSAKFKSAKVTTSGSVITILLGEP